MCTPRAAVQGSVEWFHTSYDVKLLGLSFQSSGYAPRTMLASRPLLPVEWLRSSHVVRFAPLLLNWVDYLISPGPCQLILIQFLLPRTIIKRMLRKSTPNRRLTVDLPKSYLYLTVTVEKPLSARVWNVEWFGYKDPWNWKGNFHFEK